MAKRQIWWDRWNGGYTPASWQAWISICLVLIASFLIILVAEWVDRPAPPAVGASYVLLWGSFFWFAERHSPPRRKPRHRIRKPKAARADPKAP